MAYLIRSMLCGAKTKNGSACKRYLKEGICPHHRTKGLITSVVIDDSFSSLQLSEFDPQGNKITERDREFYTEEELVERPIRSEGESEYAAWYRKTDRGRKSQGKYRKTDKRKKSQGKYDKSDKGKKTQEKHRKSDKRKKSQGKYDKSDKRKKAQKRYDKSDKRKKAQKRYDKSNKRKKAQKRYRKSDKGLANSARGRSKRNLSLAVLAAKDVKCSEGCEDVCPRPSTKTGAFCACCGTQNNLTTDHIEPLVKGGYDFCSNLQALCSSCNSSKNDFTHCRINHEDTNGG